jgi:type II secretory pathway pseudopilin PulG
MKPIKVVLLVVLGIVLLIALDFGTGFLGAFRTSTVGKAQMNAQRTVFEQSQSYVEGKRQELTKYHHEWVNADKDSKLTIEATIRQSFANFDESKLDDLPDLQRFLITVKNK